MARSFPRLFNTLISGLDKILARRRLRGLPLRIHIEVNDYCNLRCPYCPRENPAIPKNTGNIPVETIEKLKPWLRRANYVGLAGNGEPFLHPQILDILSIITEAGAVPSVITNGTRIRGDLPEKLARMGPMLLYISMDGGRKETFERWRRGADFDEVMANLRALKEAKSRAGSPYPVVNFNVCLMKENIEETELIVERAAEIGAAQVMFQTMFPYVKSLEELRIEDLGKADAAIEKARRKAAPLGIKIEYLPMSYDLDYRDGTAAENKIGSIEDLERGYRAGTKRTAENKAIKEAEKGLAGEEERRTERDLERKMEIERENEKRMDAAPESASAPGDRTPYYCRNVWQQLHVTLKGEVRFCCFWTGPAVGNILEAPLETLWNGPAWDHLRGSLSKGIKPIPCQGCHLLEHYSRRKILRETWAEWLDLWRR